MKLRLENLGIVFLLIPFCLQAQVLTTDPVFPKEDQPVTIFFDASQGTGGLKNCACSVYIHTGVLTNRSSNTSDWKYTKTQWGVANNNWRMTPVSGRPNVYSFTIEPSIRSYYGVPSNEEIKQMAFVFRNNNGSREGKASGGSDILYTVFSKDQPFSTLLNSPESNELVVNTGESIPIDLATSEESNFKVFDNDSLITEANGQSLQTDIIAGPGEHVVRIEMRYGENQMEEVSFSYTGISPKAAAAIPDDRELGITLVGDSLIRLALHAPEKSTVFVLGNFNDWSIREAQQMTPSPDGEVYWLDVDVRDQADIYFQYLVDGAIKIADPYSELILDPVNDRFINQRTFPGLPSYPQGAEGIISWVRKNPPSYQWEVDSFQRPPQEELVIYELLIRDFIRNHDYETLIDSLNYLENLGINAIELLPINEFEGNISWGYNPSFHLALDKYYGTPEAFKRFVDECHKRGIAVILDVVYNHAFSQSPLAQLYWDNSRSRPASNSPYFNTIPTHPFNVGSDFNHDSPATQYYVERAIKYWLEEYRVDGYRFDLATGFSQRNVGSNVSAWNSYDQNRVNRLQQYMDVMETTSPGSYPILEYFPDLNEKQEMVDRGALVWSGNNVHGQYKEAILGNSNDLSDTYYGAFNYSSPAHISYMESHDENRLTYEALNFGRSNGNIYKVTDLSTALDRLELASVFYYSIPGPKMLWMFGELGYDYHINTCPGSLNLEERCRIDPKPIRWDYFQQQDRRDVYDVTRDMIYLKTNFDVFNTSSPELDLSPDYNKKIILRSDDLDVVVHGNFNISNTRINNPFPYAGVWYDYFSGESITVNNPNAPVDYQAGEYRLYTSKKIERPSQQNTVTNTRAKLSKDFQLAISPQPAKAILNIQYILEKAAPITIDIIDLNGQLIDQIKRGQQLAGEHQIQADLNLPSGMYLLKVSTKEKVQVKKFVVAK